MTNSYVVMGWDCRSFLSRGTAEPSFSTKFSTQRSHYVTIFRRHSAGFKRLFGEENWKLMLTSRIRPCSKLMVDTHRKVEQTHQGVKTISRGAPISARFFLRAWISIRFPLT